MKNILYNRLFIFILGGIVFGGIVYAYQYQAKDITYTPSNSNWKVNNVKSAIDSIKNTNDTTIANLESANSNKDQTIESLQTQLNNVIDTNSIQVFRNVEQGDRIPSRSVSLTLDPGKYMIFGTDSSTTTWNSNNWLEYDRLPNINISCTSISGMEYFNTSSNVIENGRKIFSRNENGIWFCDIKTRTTVTVTSTEDCCTENFSASSATIQAIKLK